jgi:hypothetical protein
MMTLAYIVNALGLQVQSVVAREDFLQKGDSMVYIELSGNWLWVISSLSSSSNPAKQNFTLCLQLHRAVVKHKVSY